jgi:hypothetical protein
MEITMSGYHQTDNYMVSRLKKARDIAKYLQKKWTVVATVEIEHNQNSWDYKLPFTYDNIAAARDEGLIITMQRRNATGRFELVAARLR